MTSYDFGDVVLVPFPFMAVTSRLRNTAALGEVVIAHWRNAGLLKASVIKPVLATVEKRLVLRRLGRLEQADLVALRQALQLVVG